MARIQYNPSARSRGFRTQQLSTEGISRMREESNRIIQGMERRRQAEKEQRDLNLQAMKENAAYTERITKENFAIQMQNLENENMQKIANIQGAQKQAQIDATATNSIIDSITGFSQTAAKVAAERTAKMIKDQTSIGLLSPTQFISTEAFEEYIDAQQTLLTGGIALDTEVAADGVLNNEDPLETYKGYVSNHGFRGYAAQANDNKVAVQLYNQILNKRLQSADATFVAADGRQFSGVEALSDPELMAQLQQQTRKDLSSYMGFTDPMYLSEANKAIDESDKIQRQSASKEGIKQAQAVIRQQASDIASTGTVEGVTAAFTRIQRSEGKAAAHDWYQENVIGNPAIPEEVARAPDLMGNGKNYSQEWSNRWQAGMKQRNATIVKQQNAEDAFKKAEDKAWVNANIDSIRQAYDENPAQAAMLVKQRYHNKGMTVPPVIAAIEREAIKKKKDIVENLVAQRTKFGNLDLPFVNSIEDATLQKTALANYQQQELAKYGDEALGIKKQIGALAKKRTGFDPSAEGNSPTTFLLTAAMTKRYVDNVKSLKDPLTAWTATQKQIEAERNDPSALFYEDPKGATNNKPYFPNIETSPRERVEMANFIDKKLLIYGAGIVSIPFAMASSNEMDATYESSLTGIVKYPPGIIQASDRTGLKPSELYNAARKTNNATTGDNKPLLTPSPVTVLIDDAPPAMRKLFLSDEDAKVRRGGAMLTGDLGYTRQQKRTANDFINMAATSGSKFPELVAAQMILESAGGTALSGTNNFFGMKATAAEASTAKQTTEFRDGVERAEVANFKNYNSPQESVDDLVNKWYKDYSGYQGVNNANSLEEAAMMLQQQGYATDPEYAQKLIQIANRLR